jgi:hypothetical protein
LLDLDLGLNLLQAVFEHVEALLVVLEARAELLVQLLQLTLYVFKSGDLLFVKIFL